VVPVIVLCFELDANTAFLALDLHVLATLYPGAQESTHPGEYFIPAFFDLRGVQACDTLSKFGLKTAEIDRGCTKSRREVRPCQPHFALYSVGQTANDLICLGLSSVQRLRRCRWDWRQRWELSHRVVAVRCRCSRAAWHEGFLPH